MNLDLGSILGQASQTYDALSGVAGDIASITQVGNQISETMQQNANDAASAAQIKANAELTETARQEASRKAIASRIGTDPSQPGWVIGQSADKIKEADQGLAQESEAIRQIDGTSFLTNPLGWIAGQLQVNSHIANYNAWARQKNQAEETAAQAEKLTTEAFQTSNALSSTVDQSYINANKVLAAYQYNQNAAQAAMQGARWNLEGTVAAANATKDKLGILFSANSAQMQDKQYQVELQRLQLSRAEFSLKQQAFKEKTDEDSLALKYIRDGYFVQTGQQMDPMKTKDAMILYKAKEPKTMSFFESGLDSAMVGNKPVISTSPFRAAELVSKGQITNMSPTMQQVGDQLATWRNDFNTKQDIQVKYLAGADPKDKSAREMAFNRYVNDQQENVMRNGANPGSVFAPADLNKVTQMNPNLYALPVWKNVLEPASKTNVNVNDPNLAFGLVTSALKEGKLSYSDAQDLSLLYAGGLAVNNQARNWIAFGLRPTTTYNASVNVPGSLGKTNFNLADKNTLSTYLNKVLANQALNNKGVPFSSADYVQ